MIYCFFFSSKWMAILNQSNFISGWTGGGKSFVSSMIMENLYKLGEKSRFVHYFHCELHFKHVNEVALYKVSHHGVFRKILVLAVCLEASLKCHFPGKNAELTFFRNFIRPILMLLSCLWWYNIWRHYRHNAILPYQNRGQPCITTYKPLEHNYSPRVANLLKFANRLTLKIIVRHKHLSWLIMASAALVLVEIESLKYHLLLVLCEFCGYKPTPWFFSKYF